MIESHKRQITFSGTEGFNAEEYLILQKKNGKPYDGIIEYMFNACSFNIYIHKLKAMLRVQLNHVFTPAAEKAISEEAKLFSEKKLLNTDVLVTFERIDDHGNLLGRVSHPNGEIALALVEAGLAKVNSVKTDEEYDAAFYKELRDAQSMA